MHEEEVFNTNSRNHDNAILYWSYRELKKCWGLPKALCQ